MVKRKKSIFIIGSVLIGVVTVLVVMLVLAGAGAVNASPDSLIISSASVSKIYDGTSLSDASWTIDKGALRDGHTAEVTVTGRQKTVGSCENKLTVNIYDAAGKDVTGDYDITLNPGTLTVLARSYEIHSVNATKEYDGTPLTAEKYIEASGSLASGHSVRVSFSGSLQNVGTAENKFTAKVYDEKNYDVTENYKLDCLPGTLEVTRRAVTFKSGDASKEYDGTPLENKDISLATGTYAVGQSATFDASAEITEPGVKQNEFAAHIIDADGNDVSDNYDITYITGKLEVIKRAVTFKSGDATKEYDGYPLYASDHTVIAGSYVSTHAPAYSAPVTLTVPGTMQNTFTVTFVDADGNDVTAYYDISYVYGTLEVKRRAVTLKSPNAAKQYDGTPLFDNNVEVYTGEVYYEHSVYFYDCATITDVGSVQNTFVPSITDARGNSVDEYYDIKTVYGTLTVSPVRLTVRSSDSSRAYNGRPLTSEAWSVYDDGWKYSDYSSIGISLGNGNYISATVNGTITDVGSVRNNMYAVIYNDSGADVTRNYEIDYDYGTLEVTKQTITVRSMGASREYNGSALTVGEWRVYDNMWRNAYSATSQITIGDGNNVAVTISGTITDVGSVRNTILATVWSSARVDKTRNYDIVYDYGTLEVTPAQITVESSTASKIYDGGALTSRTFRVLTSGGWSAYTSDSAAVALYGGDYIRVAVSGTITDAGSAQNLFSVAAINKSSGIGAAGNYEVRYVEGTLTVYKRTITVRSATESKRYDRSPLTNGDWALYGNNGEAGELNALAKTVADTGHTVTTLVNGTITEPGSVPNYFAYVAVTDARGADVTVNYEIKEQPGTLTVYTDGGFSLAGNSKPTGETVLKITADKDGSVLLKQTSAGDFRGNGFASAPNYGDTLDGEAGYWYLATYALVGQAETVDATIELITSPAVAPYYLTTEKGDVQPSDVRITMTGKTYEVKYYNYMLDVPTRDVLNSVSLSSAYRAKEQTYRQFVHKNYTAVPENTKTYMQGLIDKYALKESNTADTVTSVAEYIRNAAKYNLEYDIALDSESNMVIAFLDKYKEGVCRHYAAAATMMYRTLGLPARYTQGVSAQTKADAVVSIPDNNYHAWVEVYFDGIGWIAIDVTGSGSSSSGGQDDNMNSPIIIKPRDAEKQYDGTPLTPAQNFVQGLTDYINNGYTYTASISGSQTAVGKSNSEIAEFVMYDPDGSLFTRYVCGVRRDGAKLDGAEFKTGTLHVYEFVLRVNTPTAVKAYDGAPLYDNNYTYSGLRSGHRIVGDTVVMPQCTDTGIVENSFDAKIADAAGNDVTDRYKIDVNAGMLIVSMREITITTASDEAEYADLGGVALTNGGYTVTSGAVTVSSTGAKTAISAIVPGAEIDVSVRGAQYNVGSCQNEISSVVITDGDGKEITYNFKIKYVLGTLTVK